jgi:hypothetical protein
MPAISLVSSIEGYLPNSKTTPWRSFSPKGTNTACPTSMLNPEGIA